VLFSAPFTHLPELIAATQAIEAGQPLAVHLLEQLDPGTSPVARLLFL
jgi:hypothetical protein